MIVPFVHRSFRLPRKTISPSSTVYGFVVHHILFPPPFPPIAASGYSAPSCAVPSLLAGLERVDSCHHTVRGSSAFRGFFPWRGFELQAAPQKLVRPIGFPSWFLFPYPIFFVTRFFRGTAFKFFFFTPFLFSQYCGFFPLRRGFPRFPSFLSWLLATISVDCLAY